MGRELFRVHPQLGPQGYKTYQISAPRLTHTRAATCAEVDCAGWAHGFRSTVDTSTALGVRQAAYIEAKSGRTYTRAQTGTLITYTFPAGQQCFTAHRVPLERAPVYLVRDGDYRGNPYGTRPVARRAEDWVDDFATHQQQLADRRQRG